MATTLPAVILVLLWIFRDRLTWNILLPGLAWRSFVVLSALPMALAVWEALVSHEAALHAASRASSARWRLNPHR